MSMHQAEGNGPGNFQPAVFDALLEKLHNVHIKKKLGTAFFVVVVVAKPSGCSCYMYLGKPAQEPF